MAARINDIADAVATLIGNGATRQVEVDINTETLSGRVVYVFGSGYDSPEMATRGEDFYDYKVDVLIANRYTGAGGGANLRDWVDDQVEWVEENVFNLLADVRTVALLDTAWPQTAAVTTLYDIKELVERKLFISVVTFTFREIVAT